MNAPLVSPTLAINEEMARRLAAGVPTLRLGFGEAGLPVLPELAEQLRNGSTYNGYGPVAGIPELRQAAAGYWERRNLPTIPDQMIAAPGSKPLLFALLHAIGGTVALPCPSWVSYAAQAALIGIDVRRIPIAEGGVPDPDLLDAAARETPIKAVIVTLPDNPTGAVASPEVIAKFCEVAQRHNLVVISDEIYRDLVHDGTQILSPAELIPDQTVVTTGLSKNLAVGGWRLGVARMPDTAAGRLLGDQIAAIASEIWSAAAHPVQKAAAWAFDEPAEVRDRIALSRRLHGSVARAVSDAFAGTRHTRPAGGFYLYPDFSDYRAHLAEAWSIRTSTDLSRVLLEELGVATLPAVAFGESDDVLAIRVATSLLYGDKAAQRLAALNDPHPEALPWIRDQLDTLSEALGKLLS